MADYVVICVTNIVGILQLFYKLKGFVTLSHCNGA